MIIKGIVQKGQQRGKSLGFPTANVPLTQAIPEGIYLAEVTLAEKQYPALTFIGAAKTFDQTEVLSETYILDFQQDIYGQEMTITLLQKLRDNEKFTTVEALIQQMKADEQAAKKYFDLL